MENNAPQKGTRNRGCHPEQSPPPIAPCIIATNSRYDCFLCSVQSGLFPAQTTNTKEQSQCPLGEQNFPPREKITDSTSAELQPQESWPALSPARTWLSAIRTIGMVEPCHANEKRMSTGKQSTTRVVRPALKKRHGVRTCTSARLTRRGGSTFYSSVRQWQQNHSTNTGQQMERSGAVSSTPNDQRG